MTFFSPPQSSIIPNQSILQLARTAVCLTSTAAARAGRPAARTLRDTLGDADVHGPRAGAIVDTCTDAGLPPYMARLIVCEDVIRAGYAEGQSFVEELFRCLRPYGGVACLSIAPAERDAFVRRAEAAALPGAKVSRALGGRR